MTWNFHENCNLSIQDKYCLSFPRISCTFSVFVDALQITVIHDESRENRTRVGPNWMISNARWKRKWWESVYCGKWNTMKEIFTNYDTILTGTISGTQQLYDSTQSTSQKLCASTQLTFNSQNTKNIHTHKFVRPSREPHFTSQHNVASRLIRMTFINSAELNKNHKIDFITLKIVITGRNAN